MAIDTILNKQVLEGIQLFSNPLELARDQFPNEWQVSQRKRTELLSQSRALRLFFIGVFHMFTLKPKKWGVRIDFPGPGACKSRNISVQEPELPSSLVLQHGFSCLCITLVWCICTWLRSQRHLSALLIAGSPVLRQSRHTEVCWECLSYGSLGSKVISPKLCYQWLRWV